MGFAIIQEMHIDEFDDHPLLSPFIWPNKHSTISKVLVSWRTKRIAQLHLSFCFQWIITIHCKNFICCDYKCIHRSGRV